MQILLSFPLTDAANAQAQDAKQAVAWPRPLPPPEGKSYGFTTGGEPLADRYATSLDVPPWGSGRRSEDSMAW